MAISIDVRAFELPASTRVSAARRRVPTGSAERASSRAAPVPEHPPAQAMSTAATTTDPPACFCCRSAIAAYPQPIRPVGDPCRLD
ncbi:hypothetical protein [Streptomyces sp. SAI-126]|uniref:hypothetical protein n=1 Tax=Streptomyces sp. SAI-126 TaxID=3377732 RepID=UPI003C7B4B35